MIYQEARRKILAELGETQEEQGAAIGMPQAHVSRAISPRAAMPRSGLERLCLLALAGLPPRARRRAVLRALAEMEGFEMGLRARPAVEAAP